MNQQGGSHYSDMAIGPIEVIRANKMGFMDGNALKYVMRYKVKGKPIEDLKKAISYLEDIIKDLELQEETKSETDNQEMVDSNRVIGKVFVRSDDNKPKSVEFTKCHREACAFPAEPFSSACSHHITLKCDCGSLGCAVCRSANWNPAG